MLNLFSSFVMYPLGAIIASLLIGFAGAMLIGYALARMNRGPAVGQEAQRAWYELPLIWIGGYGISIGLIVPAEMVIATLPDFLPGLIFVLIFVVGSFVLVPLIFFVRRSLIKRRRKKQATSAGQERHASSKDAFIQENPLLMCIQDWLFLCALWGCMLIWFACGLLFRLIGPSLFTYVLIIGGGLSLFWYINRALVQLPHLKRIEHLRVQCAEKSWLASVAFAAPYPFQEPIQLLPPLLLRLTWSAIVSWGLYWGLIALPFSFHFSLFVASLAGIYYFKLRLKIEATQYGLKMTSGFQTKSILWQDARLFACYRVPNFFFWEKNTLTYELSSPGQMVQWTCVVDRRSPFAPWQPVTSINEYQRQVQMLATLISEKTGLPLYDLTALETNMSHTLSKSQSLPYNIT